MIPRDLVTSWAELARQLGTTTRTLQNWRNNFRSECPQMDGGKIPVQAWKIFAYERGLRPANEWENPTAQKATPANPDDVIVTPTIWARRREKLFDVVAFLHDAHTDGNLPWTEYSSMTMKTAELVIQIGRFWGVEIDEEGFRNCTCAAIVAKHPEEPEPA
jgi:hypothetical protein